MAKQIDIGNDPIYNMFSRTCPWIKMNLEGTDSRGQVYNPWNPTLDKKFIKQMNLKPYA